MIRALLALALCLTLGCEVGAKASPPVTTCVRAGTRCTLDSGKLGVCTAKGHAPDGSPLLTCASQH